MCLLLAGQTGNGRWHLLSSSSVVVVCNRRICILTHQGAAHGGLVVLRPIRVTPCLYYLCSYTCVLCNCRKSCG